MIVADFETSFAGAGVALVSPLTLPLSCLVYYCFGAPLDFQSSHPS